jgi:hypothetical protein
MDGIGYSNPLSRGRRSRGLNGRVCGSRMRLPSHVRDAYQDQLDRLGSGLADMCNPGGRRS